MRRSVYTTFDSADMQRILQQHAMLYLERTIGFVMLESGCRLDSTFQHGFCVVEDVAWQQQFCSSNETVYLQCQLKRRGFGDGQQ